MPFRFVDDGYPEADDYASNYEWVEGDQPGIIRVRGHRTAGEVRPEGKRHARRLKRLCPFAAKLLAALQMG